MYNPQLKDGFVKIANELWEAWTRIRIPGECRQVLDAIIRQTYGYNKKTDRISLSQFIQFTGIRKSNVVRAIKKLQEMRLITVIKKENYFIPTYSINKHYDEWKPLSKKKTLSNMSTGVLKKENDRSQKRVPQKTLSKDNIKNKYPLYIPLLNWFWENYSFRNGKKIGKKQTLDYLVKYVKESEFELFKKATLNYCQDNEYTKDPFRFIHNKDWDWKEHIPDQTQSSQPNFKVCFKCNISYPADEVHTCPPKKPETQEDIQRVIDKAKAEVAERELQKKTSPIIDDMINNIAESKRMKY